MVDHTFAGHFKVVVERAGMVYGSRKPNGVLHHASKAGPSDELASTTASTDISRRSSPVDGSARAACSVHDLGGKPRTR